jgi:hypothetical protein
MVGLDRILGGIDDLAFVWLTRRDVVRHRIVADIVSAYERVGGGGPVGRGSVPGPSVGPTRTTPPDGESPRGLAPEPAPEWASGPASAGPR